MPEEKKEEKEELHFGSSIKKKYQLDDSILESEESEYESATEQSFDLTPAKFNPPRRDLLDVKDVQISEEVDDIADIFSGMKLASALKPSRSAQEDNDNDDMTIDSHDRDDASTPTPPFESISDKPSEVDDLLAQLKRTDLEEDLEDERQVREKLLDLSLPTLTNSAQEEIIKPKIGNLL